MGTPQSVLSGSVSQTLDCCLKHRTQLKRGEESSSASAGHIFGYQPFQGFCKVSPLPESCKGILCESRTLEVETGSMPQLQIAHSTEARSGS